MCSKRKMLQENKWSFVLFYCSICFIAATRTCATNNPATKLLDEEYICYIAFILKVLLTYLLT